MRYAFLSNKLDNSLKRVKLLLFCQFWLIRAALSNDKEMVILIHSIQDILQVPEMATKNDQYPEAEMKKRK